MRLTRIGSLALLLSLSGCGGIDEQVDTTLATVAPVRGDSRLGDETVPKVARASATDRVQTPERGLARVSLDLGPQLLLGP